MITKLRVKMNLDKNEIENRLKNYFTKKEINIIIKEANKNGFWTDDVIGLLANKNEKSTSYSLIVASDVYKDLVL